jgi:hypothetical protein
MSERHPDPGDPKNIPKVEVYWTTVTYKTVAVYISLAFAILLLVLYLLAPERFMSIVRSAGEKMTGGSSTPEQPVSTTARFVNLDGKVQVKKVNSVQWVNADYRTTLDKGDLIQTGSDGVARLTFPDGTTYTVKADTLITVEENQMATNRRTDVAVRVSTGAVDLSTGAYEPGSRSEVLFEDARASLQRNTRGSVRTDPDSKQHEMTVTQGGASMDRGGQQITIAPFERVSFPTGGATQKSQVVAPPQLRMPVNLQPMMHADPKKAAINFEWDPVPGAVSYLLRVSTSSSFNQNVREQRTNVNGAVMTGLPAGDYFWTVTATDDKKRTSEPSETFKFILAVQGRVDDMVLEIEHTQVYGNQVEIVGKTEPGAALLINGQAVTNISPEGRFRYFTPPLAKGAQKIRINGQNRRGGFKEKIVEILIP